MEEHGQSRSFLDIDAGVDVVSSDGQRVGALEHVLADEPSGIFDGVIVHTSAGPGGRRFVDAPEVDEFRERAVRANPAVMRHGGEEDSEGALAQKLRRAWDLISGRY
jgi:hypothetical protein